MPNTPESFALIYAINKIGAIANIIHPLSSTQDIERALHETNSSIIFCSDVAMPKARYIKVKHFIMVPTSESLGTILKTLYNIKSAINMSLEEGMITWKEFLNYATSDDVYVKRDANSPAAIIYSGGTTGKPKGIVLTNMNFNALALSCHKMIEQSGEGESILAILPIFHGFGLGVCIHTTLGCGMRVVLVPNFNPKDFGKLLHKHKISIVCGVPSLFESLTKTSMGKNDLSKLKSAISGGDFMSKDLKNKVDTYFREHGSNAEIRVGYGLTEASAAICVTPTGEYRESSIGVPFPDTYIKVVRVGTHDEVPYGEDGEICISGPTVMMGYLNNLEETIQTLQIHEDGRTWLHAGDVGSMDKDGFVYFKQRVKRIIISNGYNLYPSYIETIINSHPDVFTSTVIGIPHPKKVQVAKAYIVLKDGVKPSKDVEKSIRLHCEKNLARYSLPAVYEFRESLPKTLVGKVAYRELEKESK